MGMPFHQRIILPDKFSSTLSITGALGRIKTLCLIADGQISEVIWQIDKVVLAQGADYQLHPRSV
jgi:hypothetical protein